VTPGPLIIKIGGRTLEEQSAEPRLWQAIARVARERAASGRGGASGGVVLVHGGGKAVDRLMARLNLTPQRRDGIRITPDSEIDDVAGVLAGSMNKRLVACLQRAGARAVGLCLSDGGTARCVKATRYAFDPGRVGEVTGGDPRLVRTLLDAGFVPVLSSIGIEDSASGATSPLLNINADDAAAALVPVLSASGLVLLTDVPGLKGADGAVIPRLSASDVESLIASGVVTGGMIPKARASAALARTHRVPVVILSGDDPSHLLSWLDRAPGTAPAGTEFTPD
jgi:acetylglutamate kinase